MVGSRSPACAGLLQLGRASVLLVLAGSIARADTPIDRPEAIEVDREAPPAGRIEFGFDGGAPGSVWAAGIQLGYLDQPITLHTTTRETHPVRRRETVALGGAFAFGPSFIVDARLPLAHQVGDRLTGFGDDQPLDRWVLGDLALGARARVIESGPFSAFVRGLLTLPTGDDHNFAGDAKWSASWLLIGRATLPMGIVIAATGGIRLRGAEVTIADRLVGDELAFGAGVIAPIPPIAHLWCDPQQVKLAAEVVGVLGDNIAHHRGPSPAEARIGIVTQPSPALTFGLRVGTALDDQIGAPRFRAMLELAWHGPEPVAAPPAPASDEP
ncbi:MAG: mopB2 [Myxococcales bacterium]|nr:mopB2 [Myxococcales bacterium]